MAIKSVVLFQNPSPPRFLQRHLFKRLESLDSWWFSSFYCSCHDRPILVDHSWINLRNPHPPFSCLRCLLSRQQQSPVKPASSFYSLSVAERCFFSRHTATKIQLKISWQNCPVATGEPVHFVPHIADISGASCLVHQFEGQQSNHSLRWDDESSRWWPAPFLGVRGKAISFNLSVGFERIKWQTKKKWNMVKMGIYQTMNIDKWR